VSSSHRGAIDPCHAPGPRRRDWVLALGGALILTDAFDAALYALFGWRATLLPGLPISRLLLLAVFAAAGLLLARDLRSAADHIRVVWLLWPAVALTFVSAIWSDQPGRTLLWAAALLGTSVFGISLAVRFSALAQSVLTAAVVTIIGVGSTLVTLLGPAFHIGKHGQWCGVYVHHNLLGRVMALGVAAAVVAALTGRRRALAVVVLLLCGGVLLATQSRASVLAALMAVVATALLVAARVWRRQAIAILASGAAVSILVVGFLVATRPGLALMARSETLTDRTTIWKGVAAEAMQAPWIGHGYGAFWPGPGGQKAQALIGLRDRINHAHNGAIDLFAELGVAGLVLVLAPLGVFAAAAVRHALEPGARACLWPATYLVFFVASNAGESALLRHKLYWALYVAVACHVGRNGRIAASAGGHDC
jgi:exopolysaccharide production protein ExoQ